MKPVHGPRRYVFSNGSSRINNRHLHTSTVCHRNREVHRVNLYTSDLQNRAQSARKGKAMEMIFSRCGFGKEKRNTLSHESGSMPCNPVPERTSFLKGSFWRNKLDLHTSAICRIDQEAYRANLYASDLQIQAQSERKGKAKEMFFQEVPFGTTSVTCHKSAHLRNLPQKIGKHTVQTCTRAKMIFKRLLLQKQAQLAHKHGLSWKRSETCNTNREAYRAHFH